MGGIGTYVVNMTDVLLHAGHKVTIITKWHPDKGRRMGFDRPETKCGGRLKIYYVPFVNDNWKLHPACSGPELDALARRDTAAAFAFSLAKPLLSLVDASDIDLIEAPEYEYPAYYYQILRHTRDAPPDARSLRVPVVIHLHSPSLSIFRENEEYVASPWQRFRCLQEKASVRYADAVLSPSAFLADEVADWAEIPRETITVVPYPLGQPLSATATTPAAPNRFLFVGRIEPRKGIFEYIAAAVAHARQYPGCEFRFVGGPHARSELGDGRNTEAIVREFIPKSVRPQFQFKGKVPRDQLANEYAAAVVCVVPSRWDNYPNTCMEAMSAGRPVLVSDRGGQAELVEDGVSGIVARADGAAGGLAATLAEALKQAQNMSHEAREQMGKAALERVSGVCKNQSVLEQHLAFYHRVIQSAAPPSPSNRSAGVLACVFAAAGADPALGRTLEALSVPEVTKCIVAASLPLPGVNSSKTIVRSLRAEDRVPPSGIRKGWWTQNIQTETLEWDEPLILFLAPGAEFHKEFLPAALRLMKALPRVAFCTGWLGSPPHPIEWAGGETDTDALLQDWEPFPACGLLRWSAVLQAGGFEREGLRMDHIIRGLQARLVQSGFNCLHLPVFGIEKQGDLTYPVLEKPCYWSDDDSIRSLISKHSTICSPLPGRLGPVQPPKGSLARVAAVISKWVPESLRP